ncbi:ABC transporter-like protein 4 [Elsinoe fawcettii]|nr:ABC transporter-like protein 4 [Elsinoe fawcettii]
MAGIGCSPADDNLFGPAVRGCRGDFDFTLLFERYFLNVVPVAIFMLGAGLRILQLIRRERCIDRYWIEYIKIVFVILYGATQVVLVVLWSQATRLPAWKESIAACSLTVAAAAVMLPLSLLEHARSLRPSVLLNAYLFITVLLDAAVLRTIWLLDSVSVGIKFIQSAALVCKMGLLILESQHKHEYVIITADEKVSKKSPEDYSGLYSQSLFWWLNGLMRQGAKAVLSPTDLYPVSRDISSELLNGKFEEHVAYTTSRGEHLNLVRTVATLLRWPIMLTVFPRIALLALTLCQPLLLRRLLSYLQSDASARNSSTGYGLIGAYGVVYIGIALLSALYWHRHYRFLTMLRGILTTAVYRKSLDLSINAEDRDASVTLMSTDVARINRGFFEVHEFWANVIQIGVATYLINTQLGTAFVGPLIVAIVSVGATLGMAKYTALFQMQWIGKIQERITFSTSVLGSMKAIKIGGLEAIVSRLLHSSRKAELRAAGNFRLLSAAAVCVAQMPMLLSPVITFAIYLGLSESRTAAASVTKVFTSLSLIVLMAEPLFGLLESVMDMVSAFACIARIQTFLQKPSRIDRRSINTFVPPLGKTIQADGDHVVGICEASFAWDGSEKPALQNITTSVPSRSLTMIIGPAGSGKSTLLRAMLGELTMVKGEVLLSSKSISWCEQTPWLQNQSIRSNITSFAHFDSDWYWTVVHACDLRSDFDALTDGDQTVIGSKGFALSGGQKQRIALARAVYAKRQLNLLDDVFSQLDMATQRFVFNRLLQAGGLLRQGDTSVVLATHAMNLLPSADHIIVLSSDGQITGQGPFEELRKTDLLSHFDFSVGGVDPHHPINPAQGVKNKHVEKNKDGKTNTSVQNLDQTRLTGDMSIYRYYFSRLAPSVVLIFLLLQIAFAFFSTFPYVWLKWWTDTSRQEGPVSNSYYIGIYAALQMAGLLFAGAVTVWTFNVMAVSTGTALHETLAKTVMSASFPFLSRIDTGSILTRFSQDIQLIDLSLPLALQVVVGNTLICIGQMGLIASASVWIAICYPPLFVIFYYVQKYYLRTSRQMRLLDLEEKAPIYTQFTETLDGLATIRAFDGGSAAIRKNHELVDRAQRPFYLMYAIQRWLALVLDLIIAALAVIVVGVAVGLRNNASPGFTGVSLTQIISFTSALKLLIMFWTQLETSIGAVTRIRQFEEQTPSEHLPLENFEPPESWPEVGTLEMHAVSAQYKAGGNDWALKGIDVCVGQGQKVAFCGRTGSGKSTMTLTWFRLLDFAAGSMFIDGIDLSTVKRSTLRSRLLFIAEEPFLLPGSVRDNIDVFHISDDEGITTALRKTLLLDVVAAAGGLDAPMSSVLLSQGQKQLLNFSRALLRRHCKIVILDEATSSIDHEADNIIQQLIRTEFREHTVIAIAHRLNTILDFDYVGVMENGRLAEYGPPAQLLQQQSKFRALHGNM